MYTKATPTNESALERTAQEHLRALGYPFITHVKTLPGTPDILICDRNVVIQVFGCFFHQHWPSCAYSPLSPAPAKFADKFRRIRERDERDLAAVLDRGYRQLTLWGCALNYDLAAQLRPALVAFIEGSEIHQSLGHRELFGFSSLGGRAK